MPTMTLDEFAEKEMALAKEQEEKQKQFQMEKPDSDSEDENVADRKTYEARSWDDWKDDHPKGSGNRKK
jgi:immunoglobulin-binding protein 1